MYNFPSVPVTFPTNLTYMPSLYIFAMYGWLNHMILILAEPSSMYPSEIGRRLFQALRVLSPDNCPNTIAS